MVQKLEKTEILQLTINYLKLLSDESRVGKTDNYKETDFKEMGFRDCMSDVSSYMVNSEGSSKENEFRSHLLSHLKCFSSQETNQK